MDFSDHQKVPAGHHDPPPANVIMIVPLGADLYPTAADRYCHLPLSRRSLSALSVPLLPIEIFSLATTGSSTAGESFTILMESEVGCGLNFTAWEDDDD
ncbi:hypothetical protein L1887_05875 [Cichorium endivia]|nr:hypothetical protein L1887_05875 [Cichorium endivia]